MKKLIAIMLTFLTMFSFSFSTITSAREYTKAEIREMIHQLKEDERRAELEEERRATARKDKAIEQAQGSANAKLTNNFANLVNTGDKIAYLEYLKKLAVFILVPVAGIGFIGSVIYFRNNPAALATVGTVFDMFARMFLNEQNINIRTKNN